MNRLLALTGVALVVAACAGPTATQTPNATSVPTPTLTPAPTATQVAAPTLTAPPSQTLPPATATAEPTASPRPSIGAETTLVTHDSFAATDSVIADFQSQAGTKLKVLKGGDAGTMVNQAILTKGNPLGDVLYGVDNTFLSRALDAGIFVPYVSPAAASIPAAFKLDPNSYVTPVDYGDVCIVYDTRATGLGGAAPHTINDLTQPQLQGHARRREPGDVIARLGVHARDDRPLRWIGRLHVARLLARICARTTSRSRTTGTTRTTTTSRLAAPAAAAVRLSFRTRLTLRSPIVGNEGHPDALGPVRRRRLLPAGGVRRRPRRRQEPRRS